MRKFDNKPNSNIISARLFERVPVKVYDCVTSTNDVAKEWAKDGAVSGSTVVANSQTKGRGRRGRSFFSPSDSGVYFSVILRPVCSGETSVLLTTATAVAVAQTIEELTGKTADVKWLNDVYVGGKKCGGILTEAVFSGDGKLDSVIVGVGVNVTTVSFPDEFAVRAGSIGEVDKNKLVASVVDKLIAFSKNLTNEHMDEYRRRCFVLGKKVTVSYGENLYDAKVKGVTDDGRLVVETNDGEKILYSEEVSLRL